MTHWNSDLQKLLVKSIQSSLESQMMETTKRHMNLSILLQMGLLKAIEGVVV